MNDPEILKELELANKATTISMEGLKKLCPDDVADLIEAVHESVDARLRWIAASAFYRGKEIGIKELAERLKGQS